jgi:hypothetical protein
MGKKKNRNRDTAKPETGEEMARRLMELHGGDCKALLRTLLKTMRPVTSSFGISVSSICMAKVPNRPPRFIIDRIAPGYRISTSDF